ncbi:hypothetical protein Plhal304r1_c030g0098611 [Plasmopara halstedii]
MRQLIECILSCKGRMDIKNSTNYNDSSDGSPSSCSSCLLKSPFLSQLEAISHLIALSLFGNVL